MNKILTTKIVFALPFALLLGAGCAHDEPGNPGNDADLGQIPNQSGPKACVEPGDCPADMAKPAADLSPYPPPPPGDTCGQQTFAMTVTRAEPNIHLVIDRSGSMSLDSNGAVPTSTTTAKWEDLSTTLNSVLGSYGDKANQWGMSIFPTETTYHSCTAGSIAVPLADPTTSIPAIQNEIAKYNRTNLLSYNGYTPTTAAIQGVVDNVSLNDSTRNNYVVLMTDGLPNCTGKPETGVTPLIAALYAQNPPVRTFVVGFGSETTPDPVASQATNPALLNDWAVAGHTDLAGTTKYYQAADAAALMAAFEQIVVGVAQCTFNLTTAPADPSLVVGYINGTAVAKDLTDGYSYDTATQSVTFHGASCMQIQADPTAVVEVVYGCPPKPMSKP